MKQLMKKLKHVKTITLFSTSRRANYYVMEQRLANYHQDRQIQRIRQLY